MNLRCYNNNMPGTVAVVVLHVNEDMALLCLIFPVGNATLCVVAIGTAQGTSTNLGPGGGFIGSNGIATGSGTDLSTPGFFGSLWNEVSLGTQNMFDDIADAANAGWEGVSTSIANGASSLWSGIKSGLGTIADGVRSAYNFITDGISNTATGIVNLFGSATAAIAGLWRGRRQEEGEGLEEDYSDDPDLAYNTDSSPNTYYMGLTSGDASENHNLPTIEETSPETAILGPTAGGDEINQQKADYINKLRSQINSGNAADQWITLNQIMSEMPSILSQAEKEEITIWYANSIINGSEISESKTKLMLSNINGVMSPLGDPESREIYSNTRFGRDGYSKGSNHHGVDFKGAVGSRVNSVISGEIISTTTGLETADNKGNPRGVWYNGKTYMTYNENGKSIPYTGDISGLTPAKASGWGNSVTIRTNISGINYEVSYAHMKSPVDKKMYKDSSGKSIVSAGQQIGSMGTTGHSDGAHLHFVVKTNEKPDIPKKYYMEIKNKKDEIISYEIDGIYFMNNIVGHR